MATELGSRVEYALAALVELAAWRDPDEPERPLKLDELAERTGAPPRYLSTLLPKLKRLTLVGSVQGPTGGYWLMRPPDMISVAEVLRGLAADDGRRKGRFEVTPPHRAALDWMQAQMESARRKLLRGITLADLVERRLADR